MLKIINKNELLKENNKLGMKPKTFLKGKRPLDRAINAYLNGQVGKFENYFALPNALVHRKVMFENDGQKAELKQSIIAMDINGEKFGNSSILPFITATSSFGSISLNRSVHESQTLISQFITMVPFTVFEQAELDIRNLKVLDRGPECTVKVKIDNPKYKPKYDKEYNELPNKEPKTILEDRHYTGASLIDADGKIFLFDIDREEIKHHIFNPFLVELPKKVSTIEDAYASLKPQEVVDAENLGLEVIRQGEWFFIPVEGEFKADQRNNWQTKKKEDAPIVLRAGNNRPNQASRGVASKMLVSGEVEHSGREHRTVKLKGWYKAVPNTSIQSFQITGDID